MEYVLVGLLVLVLAAGFVVFLTANARRQDRTGEGGAPGVGTDHTPFGDTAEHAGQHDESGRTPTPDARGDTGKPAFGAKAVPDPDADAAREDEGRFQRDPVGGEAEGRPYRRQGE